MNFAEKSTLPSNAPSGGMRMSSTKDETIFPKAAPTMTPTARSMTFPRMANSLNSFSTVFSFAIHQGKRQPRSDSQIPRGQPAARIIQEAHCKRSAEKRARFVFLLMSKNQDRAKNTPYHEQSTCSCEQRPHPWKRHPRNDQHQDSQKHE